MWRHTASFGPSHNARRLTTHCKKPQCNVIMYITQVAHGYSSLFLVPFYAQLSRVHSRILWNLQED